MRTKFRREEQRDESLDPLPSSAVRPEVFPLVSRLLGDVMGKTQSLDRRQDKCCPSPAASDRDGFGIPSPSESPSVQRTV